MTLVVHSSSLCCGALRRPLCGRFAHPALPHAPLTLVEHQRHQHHSQQLRDSTAAAAQSQRAGAYPLQQQQPWPQKRHQQANASKEGQGTYYPGLEEEVATSSEAFHRAYNDSRPDPAKVPGLQSFAAALYARRRLITSGNDPLQNMFDEFDTDNDGILSSSDLVAAMKSYDVYMRDEQAQWLMNAFAATRTCALPSFKSAITRQEWPNFVHSLAVSDPNLKSDGTRSIDEP